MKNVCILDCGPSLSEVSEEFGFAPQWIMSMLKDTNCKFSWIRSYKGKRVKDNFPESVIITGSPQSAYEELDWMLELESYIRYAKKRKISILGICFGHQLIAKALGGKVELNSEGWELGSYPVNLTKAGIQSPVFHQIPNPFIACESHKDVVAILPDSAVELANNAKGNQAFQVGDRIFGVQFHPEFSTAVIKKYVEVRSGKGVPVDDPSVPFSKHSHLILHNFIQYIA